MPRVLCTLENASTEINGVKFEAVENGMLSEDVSDEVAENFLSITGYEPADAANASAPAPSPAPAPAPTPSKAPAAAKTSSKKAPAPAPAPAPVEQPSTDEKPTDEAPKDPPSDDKTDAADETF